MIILIGKSCYTFQMPKVSSDTQENLLIATSCKIRKQAILSNIQRHGIPFPIPKDRDVYWVKELWTKARNPSGHTPNPVTPSQTHGALVSKGLNGSIPATQGLGSSTPYMLLSMAGVSKQRFLNILCSQNATQTSSSQLHAILCHSILPHWGYESAKQGWMEQCWTETTKEESMTSNFAPFLFPELGRYCKVGF